MSFVRAYLGLGGNLGNAADTIRQAVALFAKLSDVQIVETSCLYRTEPVGMAESALQALVSPCEPLPWFVNAVLSIDTTLSAGEVLSHCLQIERQLGRIRPTGDVMEKALGGDASLLAPVEAIAMQERPGYLSRTLDIDLLFYGQDVFQRPGLTIPHPRLHERAFVLVPMLEIAPDWPHSTLKKTIRQLHLELKSPEVVQILDTL